MEKRLENDMENEPILAVQGAQKCGPRPLLGKA